MILVAKAKFVFKIEWANGIKKKDFKDVKLQETPTCTFHFKLSEVRAFSDNDIEYIIEKLPKFSDFKTKVKNAKGELVARHDEIVEFLKKWKPVKFDTLTSANSRIKLSMKLEHYIAAIDNHHLKALFLSPLSVLKANNTPKPNQWLGCLTV